jgi:hypothetical protein
MNKRMKMKLLDYTLISLLAGTAPLAGTGPRDVLPVIANANWTG